MKHFTLGDWVDFARHLKDASLASEMQAHLDRCQRCSRVVRMWRDLSEFASKETSYRPPDGALRAARGYYIVIQPAKRRGPAATLARLIFDSLLEPMPAAIRSSQTAMRHLIYASEGLLITMQVERRSGRVCLVGQVQDGEAAYRGVAGLRISALRGAKAVAKTKSNQFGEFQCDLEASREHEPITVVIQNSRPVVIPLHDAGARLV